MFNNTPQWAYFFPFTSITRKLSRMEVNMECNFFVLQVSLEMNLNMQISQPLIKYAHYICRSQNGKMLQRIFQQILVLLRVLNNILKVYQNLHHWKMSFSRWCPRCLARSLQFLYLKWLYLKQKQCYKGFVNRFWYL